jgi:hypothetical protein
MKAHLITWLPPAIALTLFAAASVVTAIYYGDTWAISYPTPISIGLLWEHRSGLSLDTLRQAWGPYGIPFLVTAAAWPVLLSRRSRRAALLAAVMPVVLLFPLNLLGAHACIFELILRPGWDGETLAEGWPLIQLYGLWSLWSLGFAVRLARRAA